MITRFAIAAITALNVGHAQALTGNDLVAVSGTNKEAATAYVGGFMGGFFVRGEIVAQIAQQRGLPAREFKRVFASGPVMICPPEGSSASAALNIVLAHLTAKPADRTKEAAFVVWDALTDAWPCPALAEKPSI